MIPGLKNVADEDRLKDLELRSLKDRRICADLIEVFKTTHGLSSLAVDILSLYSTQTVEHEAILGN